MTTSPGSSPCVAFARRLSEHVAASQRGEVVEHAAACADCQKRLRLAIGLGSMAASKPELPSQLQTPQFLASVYERVVDAAEASPIGQQLEFAMRVQSPGDSVPWPAQTLGIELRSRLDEAAVPTSTPIRPFVAAGATGRALARRNFAAVSAVAASVALLAVFGWQLSRSEGTNEDVRIVFVPVSELPAVMHPTAVLRRAAVR